MVLICKYFNSILFYSTSLFYHSFLISFPTQLLYFRFFFKYINSYTWYCYKKIHCVKVHLPTNMEKSWKFLKYQRLILRYWNHDITKNLTLLSIILTFFNYLFCFSTIIPQIQYILNNLNNKSKLIDGVGPFLAQILILTRIPFLIYNKNKFNNFIKKLKKLWNECKYNF